MKSIYAKIGVGIIVSELAGVIGSLFTTPNISTWYSTLTKPALNPPSWIFAPVWTTLFILMGIASGLIWHKGWDKKSTKIALSVFAVQLVLNALWSIIFFGLHNPTLAFAEVIVLWLAILATMILFAKISKPAMWLLVPYILWVSFASYLNFSYAFLTSTKLQTLDTTPTNTPVVGLANPASTNCVQNGGTLQIEQKPDGGQYGLCYFDDARACEEWAMMRGDCAVGGRKTTGYDTVEQKYCAWVGGRTTTNEGDVCTFDDNSICALDKLYNGDCQKGTNPAKTVK